MTNPKRAVKPTRRKIITPEEILELREFNERWQQEKDNIRLQAFKEAVLRKED